MCANRVQDRRVSLGPVAEVIVRPGSRLAVGDRVIIVVIAGALAAFLAIPHIGIVGTSDFDQLWYGAYALVHGGSPYAAVGPGRAFPWPFPLLYPLPGVITAIPFTALPVRVASMLFSGISGLVLALALTRSGPHRIIALTSFPFYFASAISQWSPLFVAATVYPGLGVLFAAKPTIGLAVWLYRPQWRIAAAVAAFLVVSWVVQPSWPGEWMAGLKTATHIVAPITYPGGSLVLLALSRWRRPEARLLVALACVPHTTLLYEVLPLFLVPATCGQAALLSVLTWIAQGLATLAGPFPLLPDRVAFSGKLSVALCYLPCVVMVLMRPNEGKTPVVIETTFERVAGWWRATISGARGGVPVAPDADGAEVGS